MGKRSGMSFRHMTQPEKWVVKEKLPRKGSKSQSYWLAACCACGEVHERRSDKLRIAHKCQHGHTSGSGKSPTYYSWLNMRQRCERPDNDNFEWYGGRGITVHPRYQKFSNFLADLGPRPDGCTLDRIDPNGNYEPGNVKWSTPKEQRRNQRA